MTSKEELKFLEKKFKTKCFVIHESSFNYLPKWGGFYKKLFLEMNKDNRRRVYTITPRASTK